MNNGIKPFEVTEGNLRATKCTGDFGGCNQWYLYVKKTSGYYEQTQWMDVRRIQEFFNTKLPVYEDKSSRSTQYKLAQ
jgi:hypothetical protein